jgi:RIO kinase 1
MAKISRDKFKVHEGVFDEFTLKTLEIMKRKHYFDELGRAIKTGKEGDVYFGYRGEKTLAIKIYRMTSANFKKISQYIVRDYRFRNIKGSLRKVILVWAEKEFRNVALCHKHNISVPYMYKQFNNVIIMDYIFGKMLKDTELKDPKEFFELLLEQMKLVRHEAKLIHGDLSEFNIMVADELPILIDWGQGMSIKNETDFEELNDIQLRDVQNVVGHFNRVYNLGLDYQTIYDRIENNN